MTAETILVVDDDRDLRDSIVEILAVNGYQVVACDSAETALQSISATPPRLVLLDYMMPGMGGMALLPLLKKDFPGTKIVMITAFATVDNAVAAMKSGADDYLAKPFRRDELLMTVRRTLETCKFDQQQGQAGMDEVLACLANQLRRQILTTLAEKGEMRFMDLTRSLGVSDHTKVGFHLKNLKAIHLISQNRQKLYLLTPQGKKICGCLDLLSRRITS